MTPIFGPNAQLKILEATLTVDYSKKGEMLFRPGGDRSKSQIACAFWRGFDGESDQLIVKGSMLHAAYKAGKACRKLH